MPLSRAQLVGETSAGKFSSTDFFPFENGTMLNVASVRHTPPPAAQSHFFSLQESNALTIFSALQDRAQRERTPLP